jgi:hypothetical protein
MLTAPVAAPVAVAVAESRVLCEGRRTEAGEGGAAAGEGAPETGSLLISCTTPGYLIRLGAVAGVVGGLLPLVGVAEGTAQAAIAVEHYTTSSC